MARAMNVLLFVVASTSCTLAPPVDRAPPHAGAGSADSATSDGGSAGATGARTDGGDGGEEGLEELRGHPEIVPLTEGGEKLGSVSVPLGAKETRPVVVALHGGSERPEVACAAWRKVVAGWAFVVCPRGWGGNERRLGWRGAKDTTERIQRAIAATKVTFGRWMKETRVVVLAGFSMGASQVAIVAKSDPKTYPRIVIGDSAHDPWPATNFSREWSGVGGERALFLCSTSGCEPSMRGAAKKAKERGAHARLNVAPTQVHGFSERVASSTRRDWPWLVEGLEGWDGYAQSDTASLPGRTETYE